MRPLNLARIVTLATLVIPSFARAGDNWKNDRIWNDGLVEKAVYAATRVVYGKPRQYEAVFFTNKEHHDRATLTKAARSTDTIEVWKHNQIEVVPTANYDYKFVTTAHLTADAEMRLTRLDASSQEFCGASFKQYLATADGRSWDYFSFSYMPEAGRHVDQWTAAPGERVIAEDGLPLTLRDFDFTARRPRDLRLLPTQKSNNPTPPAPTRARVRFAEETPDAYKLELVLGEGIVHGSYWMAKDRLHVMLRYQGVDGQRYTLTALARTDYWSAE